MPSRNTTLLLLAALTGALPLACGARTSTLDDPLATAGAGASGSGSGGAGGNGGAPSGSSSGETATVTTVTTSSSVATSSVSTSTGCVPAPEVCDGADNDCNGEVDDPGAQGCSLFFQDGDGDGFGTAGGKCFCGPTDSFTASQEGDCNDMDPGVHPGATELCDGVDRNCDSLLCNCDVRPHNGRNYYFCPSTETWKDAAAACSQLSAHLVRLDDAEEAGWVNDRASSISQDRWWIGLTDEAQEDVWTDDEGIPVVYLDWGPGEPNDANNNQDCGQLNRFYPDSGWNDDRCDKELRYICK